MDHDNDHYHVTIGHGAGALGLMAETLDARTIATAALRTTAPKHYRETRQWLNPDLMTKGALRLAFHGMRPIGSSGLQLRVSRCFGDAASTVTDRCQAPGRSLSPATGDAIATDAWRRFDGDVTLRRALNEPHFQYGERLIRGAADHLSTAIVAAADLLVAR